MMEWDEFKRSLSRTELKSIINMDFMIEFSRKVFTVVGDRLNSHDAEIDALQTSKAEMLQDIERLKAQVKLIEHEMAIVQRKSLAQKLREKGVGK